MWLADQQTPGMDPMLTAVVEHNGGFFTRSQALDQGWTDRELAAGCHMGVLRHLRHGAYSVAASYDPLDEGARHLVLARAVVAIQRGPVALTGVSAAVAHGLSVFGHDLSNVHLVRLDGGSSRGVARAHHQVVSDDVAHHLSEVDGLPVTTLARTVWETAAHASLEAGVATADSALHEHPWLVDELAAVAPVFATRPGSRRARAAIALADGRAESPGESYSRVIFERFGVPKPQLQVPVLDADGREIARCDFGWEDDHHVGEFDGKVKYGRLLRPGESPGDAVFREKRREDRVRGKQLGMSRWVFADLSTSQVRSLIGRINAERAQSRALYGRHRTFTA